MYDVINDLIQGQGVVQNCRASYWSALFALMSHMTSVYFEGHDWSK